MGTAVKLLVDVGNSQLKWAFERAGGFIAQGNMRREDTVGFRALLESPYAPTEIRVANVAGTSAGAAMAAALKERFGVVPVFATSAAAGAGVVNGYINPAQLGTDRWLGICAAYAGHRAALCVVDAGTATTIDLVSAAGQHLGGLILPGMALMQTALFAGTGDLARLASVAGAGLAREGLGLGRDTAAAIRLGALQATVGAVRACMEALGANAVAGRGAQYLVITGGAGPSLVQDLHRTAGAPGFSGWHVDSRPHLVLEGLALDPPCYSEGG